MLFDTSVFIDCLQGNDSGAIYFVELVMDGLESGRCSVITEAELWAGIRNRQEEVTIAALLSKFEVIPLTSNIARVSGSLIRGRSSAEIRAHFADAMIAASAIEVNQTILTADGRSKLTFPPKLSPP